jgi:hypothetical protein
MEMDAVMGKGGFHLPSSTVCCVCGHKIRRTQSDSYSCAIWLQFQPAHFACAAKTQPREMAAAGGDE